ncbi:cystathionine gamma-synthase [Brumimicrobium salinarum]|uniref:Cystathionine gamma-synthase n=1 Tax=Brumimicrobium salinarum TaxID=2058658 RepID=A0A2I0R654_9FLAO|nr:cystathionine gamma-synthase [Brumimicrobium salinarum]PKR82049.1 cystathionine gamma-synthase [Brumimicrobium salinarum]
MAERSYKFDTKAIHAGVNPDPTTGAVMTPIYQTTTFAQEKVGEHKGFAYARSSNPTRNVLENAIAALENTKYGACFGSGVAAIDAVLKLLSPGDEVITTDDLYGGSYRIFTTIFAKYGIKFHFIKMKDVKVLEQTINKKTKLVWVETPTNPMMNIVDLAAISKITQKNNLLLAVDNTFATPYLQTPIDLGADIVMHSATKYLGGHSDVVMGFLATNNEEVAKEIYHIQNTTGAIAGPMDSFLVLRGLKTLHLRMERHCENGAQLAYFLRNHPQIEKVHWPGFKDHPNHAIAKKQMKGFGGMLSFTLKGDSIQAAHKLMESFKVITLAESLGGVESLVCHPATMTHAALPKEEREKAGITDSLIRLSVGVEHIEDLKQDIMQALTK